MPKFKKVRKESFTRAEIEAVVRRLELLIEINSYYEQSDIVSGNTMGLAAGKQLLKQLLTRGEMWTGGYLDNVGVVYTDQVAAHLEMLKEKALTRDNQ